MVKTISDTPTLIQRIAENQYYLKCCAAIFKPDGSKDIFLWRLALELKNAAEQQQVSYDKLQEMLAPVAIALGLKEQNARSMQSDFYKRLGISLDASNQEIKAAYRNKAREAHPDTETGENEEFIKIQEAYQVLSEASLRRQYDLSRRYAGRWDWHEDSAISNEWQESFLQRHRMAAFFVGIILLLVGFAFLADIVNQQYDLKKEMALVKPESKTEPQAESPPKKLSEILPITRNELPAIVEIHNKASNISMQSIESPSPDRNTNELKPVKETKSAVTDFKEEEVIAESQKHAQHVAQVSGEEKTQEPSDIKPLKEKEAEVVSEPLSVKLKDFLGTYCKTYEDRNIEKFINFFADDAMENGEPFKSLLPKYRENFETIDRISYHIDMANYLWDLDQNRVRIEGEFFLEWQKEKGSKPNNFSGNIKMGLIFHQDSFLIKNLSYSFKK